MRPRPTVVLLHGGPGSYDHSYFKPEFARLANHAQVVYLDLRDHGRSAWGAPSAFSFEVCAADLRAFCDALGIAKPIVLGHSLGGFVALAYAIQYPDHPGGLVVQSCFARFDLARIVEGFRRAGGDEVARITERFYSGDPTASAEFRARCRPLFGAWVPGDRERARIIVNEALLARGLELMRGFDVLDRLARITCPTLVCTGELDPITQVADAREIAGALAHGNGRLEVIPGAGHFPWKDAPDRYWPVLTEFVATVGATEQAGRPS